MPEDLPAEPSIKPLVDEKRRKEKRTLRSKEAQQGLSLFDENEE
jgi:hypothetical protein